jgi:glycosyltransferase involved in cell wall biosynthesis
MGALLDTDWHEVEPTPDGPRRWSSALSHIRFSPNHEGGTLVLRGTAPWSVDAKLGAEDGVAAKRIRGAFELRAEIPRGVGRVPLRIAGAQRPLRDFRTLGVMLAGMSFENETRTIEGDLWRDARSFASDEELWSHTQRQPEWMEGSFARLRGPNSPELEDALAKNIADFDVIVSANLPWKLHGGGTARGGKPRRVLIPLMHVGDAYYYRRQYLDAMRKADLVAAMTPWAASKVFPKLGAVATFVGAPVWPDERLVRMADARPVRDRSAMRVLTVSRKSPDKRYREIAESVVRVRAGGASIEFIGVGEDIDGAAMPEGTSWRGALGDDALRECWLHADVFVLMSESESFGMVIVEAWHARLPVIANPRCGPVASLIEDGVTGILATPGAGLDAALARLARDPELRRRLADAGCARARREFVRGAAAQRLVDALSTM